jgi:dCTP deaminase
MRIITPFSERTIIRGMSYGLSSSGYDIRVEFAQGVRQLALASPRSSKLTWPVSFALAATIEHFKMPDNVLGIVHDKSTWARVGIAVQNTVIEPGWRGHLTLELTNHGDSDITICEGDPIAQVVFHWLDMPTEHPYPDTGKYQDQGRGPQQARLEEWV